MTKLIICKDCGEEKEHCAKGLCKVCYTREDYKKTVSNHKKRHLMNTFGITLEQYDEMLEAQGGVCWICGKTPEENGRRLSIDHDHKTDKIRGLLCKVCNMALGCFGDDPQLTARATEYLLREV